MNRFYKSSSPAGELLFLDFRHFLVIFILQFAITRDKLGGRYETNP